jgi:serine phosphatase RsbU (regulator of sigma subunit)
MRANLPVEEIRDRLIEGVARFSARHDDDVTVVVIRRSAGEAATRAA